MTNHVQAIWKKFCSVDGFRNKLSAVFKGPGWSPGTPWLGYLEDIPEPKDDELKYDPKLPRWLELYVILHAAAMVIGYLQMIMFLSKIPNWTTFVSSLYIILTTISIGCLLDLSSWGPLMELLRCPLYFLLDMAIRKEFSSDFMVLYASMYAFRCLFFASFIFWLFATPSVKKQK